MKSVIHLELPEKVNYPDTLELANDNYNMDKKKPIRNNNNDVWFRPIICQVFNDPGSTTKVRLYLHTFFSTTCAAKKQTRTQVHVEQCLAVSLGLNP